MEDGNSVYFYRGVSVNELFDDNAEQEAESKKIINQAESIGKAGRSILFKLMLQSPWVEVQEDVDQALRGARGDLPFKHAYINEKELSSSRQMRLFMI